MYYDNDSFEANLCCKCLRVECVCNSKGNNEVKESAKKMNGLEAIELMKQGKIVKRVDCDLKFRINNNRVEEVVDIGSIQWNFQVNEEYEEYIEPKQLTGWERVDFETEYFHILYNGNIVDSTELFDNFDNKQYELANYFSTKEKTEEINFKQTLFRKLQRFSDENGGNEIDWYDHEQAKWSISLRIPNTMMTTSYLDVMRVYSGRTFGQVYFISEEVTRKAIELFRDDLIKYFTHDLSKGE